MANLISLYFFQNEIELLQIDTTSQPFSIGDTITLIIENNDKEIWLKKEISSEYIIKKIESCIKQIYSTHGIIEHIDFYFTVDEKV